MQNNIKIESITYKKLDYHVVYEIDDYILKFKVYPCAINMENGEPIFTKAFSDEGFDPVDDIKNAKIEIEGSIKCDGCIDYNYPEHNHCMLHHCGLSSIKNEWELFKELFKYAANNIPHASKEYILE